MANSIRGDGLSIVQTALEVLERDPQRLDRARKRFDESPPPYISDQSGTTTLSQSPNPPSEEQRRRQERRVQLGMEANASRPDKQFRHQINEEEERVFQASLSGTYRIPVGSDPRTIAREKVKKLWVEQGIWNNKWNQFAYGRWKHEEPLELESESKTGSEAGLPPPVSSFPPKPQPKPGQPKSDDEKRQVAERRVLLQREREASRPYHQFIYQISKERERIQEESENGEGANAAHINTRAYENVRNTWTKRKIWSGRWGIMPGMSWKHEEPLEEDTVDGPAPVPANPHVSGSHDTGEVRTIRNFRSPSPVESNCRQTSGTMNTPQQRSSGDTDTAQSEDSDAEHSSSEPNSPRLRAGKRVLRPTAAQASRPNRKTPPHGDGQPRPATTPSLSPIHSSKVSKAARERVGPQRRLNTPQNASSDGLSSSSSVDAAEPQPSPLPDRLTARRSKRMQPPVPSVAGDPAETASTKRSVRSKSERSVASNLTTRGSAKPKGISKRQPAKTTRGKAGKK